MTLDVAGLKARLRAASPPAFAVYGDDRDERDTAAGTPTPAAVLVPIVQREEGLTVLFTQRTTHLKAHAGQVSFPGGRAEPGDASPEFTALREAEEEIGLKADRVEIIARLPDYHTRTGYLVSPIVAVLTPPLELVPDPREVAEIFEVPLAFLLDPANHRRQTREWQGRTVGFYEMPYGDRYIWGATAGMIVNLCRALSDVPQGG
ncbi:MAG TPA: CoA pyrophosphatase [Burkholderiales bacterium]|nr:CoA pyrophosphatase [Burkholderiales bacterium]